MNGAVAGGGGRAGVAHKVSLRRLKGALGNFSSQAWGHRLKTVSPTLFISHSLRPCPSLGGAEFPVQCAGCSCFPSQQGGVAGLPPSLALLAA